MRSEKPLDYAVFQLSPRRSRCELLVSSDGKTEKLASGLVKPFVAHLKVVEEQFVLETQLIKLEIDKHRKPESWFTKGTLERFVRFVSTPDLLELFNTYDSEMSQLEAALNIYSQGTGDRLSGSLGGDGMGTMAVGDATKKELLRAIDVRLLALKQDLTTACSRAASAGFNSQSVCELQLFSDRFGAHRLNEACAKFLSLCQKRPELCNSLNTRVDDCTLRSSYSSDMSIDDSPEHFCRPHFHSQNRQQEPQDVCEESPVTESPSIADTVARFNEEKKEGIDATESSSQTSQSSRRLSVQDRINIFENKQKQSSGSGSGSGRNTIVGKSTELRKQSPNAAANTSPAVAEKAVLRRWSGSSDMSIDLGNDRKESLNSPAASQAKPDTFLSVPNNKDLKDHPDSQTCLGDSSGNGGEVVMKSSANQNFQSDGETQARDGAAGTDIFKQTLHQNQFKPSVANRDLSVLTDQGASQDKSTFSSSSQASGRFIDPLASEAQFTVFSGHKQALSGIFSNKSEEVGRTHSRPSTRLTVHSPQFHSQTHAVLSEGHGGKEVSEGHWRKAENSRGGRDLGSSEKDPENFENEGEDLGEPTSKFQGQRLGPQRAKKSHVRIESSNDVADIHKNIVLSSTEAEERNQRGRQVKENQGLNDKLKIKANELEKLFAEHRLRAPDDPLISNQRSTPNDLVTDPSAFSQFRKSEAESVGYSSPVATLNAGSGRKLKDSEDNGVGLKNVSELGFSNDSRGKFYEKYRRKRDAKLKEEWISKGAEKEAKMKAMHDSLERSSAEMKAKFARSAEKFKKREQQATNNPGSEEDEDLSSELSEQKLCEQDSLFSESKKLTPNKFFSSMTPYVSSQLFVRGANSAPVRQRGQLESPSLQSVSNFTDLRKENTKPSSVTGEKPHPLKKNPPDFNDRSTLIPNDVLTPSKSVTSQRFEKRKNRNAELKPFNWKGNGIGPGSGFVSLPDSTSPVALKLEDGMLESHIQADYCIDAGSEDEEEEFDTLVVEDEDAVGSVSDMNTTPVPVQDLLDESPLLWNSSLQPSFLYPESLDINLPATSAMGSAATWNSHPLTQTEAEAARMRKKWGGAHKPVVNSSQNQSRKDVTKGFKRLLKFGRKNGGTELVDWISATTSEGDDDTEDGRDPGNQSAEDLRKLRMVPSEDVFNDSEVFDEHVRALGRPIPAPPASLKLREDHLSGNSLKASRSFFSLSTFRSRGTDSRTR